MSDLYSELLVKKEPTAKDSIVKYGMIVLTVLAVGAEMCIRERCRSTSSGRITEK